VKVLLFPSFATPLIVVVLHGFSLIVFAPLSFVYFCFSYILTVGSLPLQHAQFLCLELAFNLTEKLSCVASIIVSAISIGDIGQKKGIGYRQ